LYVTMIQLHWFGIKFWGLKQVHTSRTMKGIEYQFWKGCWHSLGVCVRVTANQTDNLAQVSQARLSENCRVESCVFYTSYSLRRSIRVLGDLLTHSGEYLLPKREIEGVRFCFGALAQARG